MKNLLIFVGLCLFTVSAYAVDPTYTALFSNKAIKGYDTVAYFTENKPVEGSEEFSVDYNGAQWLFSSAENLELFKADPEKYAPQYGGYCAYGIAVDNLVKIEGDLWDIVDGKLYLNYNKKLQAKWRKDIPGYIKTADGKFQGLLVGS